MRAVAIACAAVALGTPAFAQKAKPGTDPPEVRAAVERLKQLGVVEGYPDGEFYGDRTLTRNEAAVALRRLIDKTGTFPEKGEKPSVTGAMFAAFSPSERAWNPYSLPNGTLADINWGDWSSPAWESLAREGIVQAFPDNVFRGKRSLTRQELATFAARLVRRQAKQPLLSIERAKFRDADGMEWSYGAVLVAAGTGLMRGYPDNTFRPKQTVTRGEFAVTLARLLPPTPKAQTP